jgi:hypothetical protein
MCSLTTLRSRSFCCFLILHQLYFLLLSPLSTAPLFTNPARPVHLVTSIHVLVCLFCLVLIPALLSCFFRMAPYSTACVRCRNKKMRCDWTLSSTGCKNCVRSQNRCSLVENKASVPQALVPQAIPAWLSFMLSSDSKHPAISTPSGYQSSEHELSPTHANTSLPAYNASLPMYGVTTEYSTTGPPLVLKDRNVLPKISKLQYPSQQPHTDPSVLLQESPGSNGSPPPQKLK